MGYTHLLACGTFAQVTAPVQPLGTVIKTPLQPAGAFVELANEYQQFIRGGIDVAGETADTAIEFVDGNKTVCGWQLRLHNTSL